MKLYSWNVNGIRAVAQKGFTDWVEAAQPDILCLQEVKASEDQISEDIKSIPGYHSFFHAAERKGYSGTAVYYKKEPLSITTGLSEDRFNHEGRTIIMEYPEFTLFNIYFPNGQKDDEKVIICGDVNTAHTEMDLKNPKSNAKRSGFLPMEREWLDHFFENGYVDTYRHLHPDTVEYSWWSYRFNARANNAGWRIDYFFVSDNAIDMVKDAAIHTEVTGSDHCPVSIEIKA